MSEEEKKFVEKLLSIIFCEMRKFEYSKDIIDECNKLEYFCKNNISNFYSDFQEFSQPFDENYILNYLVFSYKHYYKKDEIMIRRKVSKKRIFQCYAKDIKIFIEVLKEKAPHIYDLVYLNWDNEIFSREYNREIFYYDND